MPGKQWVPKFIKDLLNGVDVSTDGTFAANSDALLPTQKAVKTLVGTIGAVLPVHDNTGAGSDYAISVGETVKLTFTSATSVPLHIVTVEGGEYEIIVRGSARTLGSYSGVVALNPNNTTYANQFDSRFTTADNADSDGGAVVALNYAKQGFSIATFNIGDNLLLKSKIQVQTITTNKMVQYTTTERLSSTQTRLRVGDGTWNDTTTVWSSLGTLSFAVAQSGTVIIRRIL